MLSIENGSILLVAMIFEVDDQFGVFVGDVGFFCMEIVELWDFYIGA